MRWYSKLYKTKMSQSIRRNRHIETQFLLLLEKTHEMHQTPPLSNDLIDRMERIHTRGKLARQSKQKT